MTLARMQERLLAWAGADERQVTLLRAREEWFARVGEPHEEDKSFEARMNGFLEHFLFDFRPDGVHTCLEVHLRDAGGDLTTDDRGALRDLGRGRHALFEVRRIQPGVLEVEDVLADERFPVVERRAVVALAKGDLIEARLLPFDGKMHFSRAFVYHPREVRKAILREAKRIRKEAGPVGAPDVDEFLARLSRMALRYERYRNVRVEAIYDFDTPAGRGVA